MKYDTRFWNVNVNIQKCNNLQVSNVHFLQKSPFYLWCDCEGIHESWRSDSRHKWSNNLTSVNDMTRPRIQQHRKWDHTRVLYVYYTCHKQEVKDTYLQTDLSQWYDTASDTATQEVNDTCIITCLVKDTCQPEVTRVMTREHIVRTWLRFLHVEQYSDSFLESGYDDMETVKLIEVEDLEANGVTRRDHKRYMLYNVRMLRENGAAWVCVVTRPHPNPDQEDNR